MSFDLVGFTASYRDKKKGVVFTLKPISFRLPKGSVLIVKGPSGSGKSTMLKAISGLIESEGDVLFEGRPLTIGETSYMGELQTLYKGRSVFESLAFPMQVAKLKEEEIKERIYQISGDLGFRNLLTRKPKELSEGQRKTIEFAKCVLKSPEVMLLDEPFSSIDPALKETLWQYILQMKRDLGTTFLLVSHDEKEGGALGDYFFDFSNYRFGRKGESL